MYECRNLVRLLRKRRRLDYDGVKDEQQEVICLKGLMHVSKPLGKLLTFHRKFSKEEVRRGEVGCHQR